MRSLIYLGILMLFLSGCYDADTASQPKDAKLVGILTPDTLKECMVLIEGDWSGQGFVCDSKRDCLELPVFAELSDEYDEFDCRVTYLRGFSGDILEVAPEYCQGDADCWLPLKDELSHIPGYEAWEKGVKCLDDVCRAPRGFLNLFESESAISKVE